MTLIKYREIARRVELEGLSQTVEHFRDALMEGHLNADDFQIRHLAEALVMTRDGQPCGREWVQDMNPNSHRGGVSMESSSAVDSTAFTLLTGQLVFSQVMKAATKAEFLYPKLERVQHSDFKKEMVPGITGINEDMEDDINEMMPYPEVGFSEVYQETPLTTKKGRILSLSKEVLFFNRSGDVMRGAGAIGDLLGIRREKQFCRALAGITNNYKWNGTTYNTYQTTAPWINVKATNGIVVSNGWVQIDAVEQLFNGINDPNLSSTVPVEYGIKEIVHMPARNHQFRRVIGASEIRDSGATTAAHVQTNGPNTVNSYPLYQSKWLYNEIVASGVSASDAADWWFAGDIRAAIAWMENWPITTVQAPSGGEADFKQDIVARWKTSMRGVYAVMEPRAVVKSYQA